jgi:beta-lactam-binding protein with PASTA domain
VTVPDLTGLTVDEVRTKLDKTGLKYEVVGKESSDSYKEGQVVRQTPKKGKKVAKNTTIQLTLSSGPAETTVAVPNVVGKSRSAAESALKELNLEVNVQYQTSDSVAKGVVISQSPKGGSDGVKEGDTVTIVVSQGQETVSVPNVAGISQSAAVTSLQNNGLTVGNISQAYNDSVAAGMVISQSVSGTQVKGTKVDLVVSLGKKPEEKPADSGNAGTTGENDKGSDDTGKNVDNGGANNNGNQQKPGEASDPNTSQNPPQSGQ